MFRDEAGDTLAHVATAGVALAGLVLARFVPSEWVASTAVITGIVAWLVVAVRFRGKLCLFRLGSVLCCSLLRPKLAGQLFGRLVAVHNTV